MTVKFMTVKGSENLGRTPFSIAGADLAPDATKLSSFPTFKLSNFQQVAVTRPAWPYRLFCSHLQHPYFWRGGMPRWPMV